jgi:putative adenylate-forming enzyme
MREARVNLALAHAIQAFWKTKRLAARWRTRDDVARYQQRRLQRFLRHAAPRVPYYATGGALDLRDLPLMDKAEVTANFDRLNVKGVTFGEARRALDAERGRVRGLIVGQSTGTSGNRGVYVLSEAERFTWLGVILAKTLPDVPWVRHTVAIVLPSYGLLYASAAETGRLAIRFFDVALGLDRWHDALRAFTPDTIVAPPQVLRALAERGGLRPRHVFSGAEVLDPLDRAIVEAAFSVTVREIYMATEGLFGVACARGTLHLAEDIVAFEWGDVPGAPELAVPIVTDFTRSTQIVARYRMNDLVRRSDAPCACGSPLQAVASVEGRQDDVFLLRGGSAGGQVMVTPDVIRNAVVDADRRILDFRVVQTHADRVELTLAADAGPDVASAAVASLGHALAKTGAGPTGIDMRLGIEVPLDRKLRRVRRDWRPPQG